VRHVAEHTAHGADDDARRGEADSEIRPPELRADHESAINSRTSAIAALIDGAKHMESDRPAQ
jgi:hypothetical protein